MKKWITPLVSICILTQISISVIALHGANKTLNESNSLIVVGEGCTDPSACNFEVNATIEDGSCYYGTATCPDDICNNDVNCTAPNPREVDVKMVATNLGCDDNLYCTKIEIRGQDGAVFLGSSSIRFTYDPAVVNFDGYTAFINNTHTVFQTTGTYHQ